MTALRLDDRSVAAPTRPGRLPQHRKPSLPPLAGSVALLAVAATVLEAVTDALPDAPVFALFTPLRLAILAGWAAVFAGWLGLGAGARARLPRWRRGLFSYAVIALLAAAEVTSLVTGTGWAPWRALLTGVGVTALTARLLTLDAGAHRGIGLLAWLGVGLAGTAGVTQAASGTATGFCRGSWSGALDVCAPGAFVRVTGTYPNPNLLAAALLLLLPLAVGWVASTQRDPAQRLIGWTVVAVGVVALALTGSRAGALGALVAVAAYLVLRRPSRVRVRMGLAGGVAAVALLGAGGWWLAGGDLGVRGTIWRAAVRLVLDHPLGVGLGQGGAALQATAGVGPAYQHAHNLWLSWFVETGVPGGLAVLAITAALAMGVVRAARDGSTWATTYGCSLAGFATMGLLDHAANAERIALLLWVVVGATAAVWSHRAPRP